MTDFEIIYIVLTIILIIVTVNNSNTKNNRPSAKVCGYSTQKLAANC